MPKTLRYLNPVVLLDHQFLQAQDTMQSLQDQAISQDQTNVFVKFLPHHVNEHKLCEMFSQFGPIISTKVMKLHSTGESLGFGFVRFSDPAHAAHAIKAMAGFKIDNKNLLCKLSNVFSLPPPSANLYIKPLPLGYTIDKLVDLFGAYGVIKTTKLKSEVGAPDSLIGFVLYNDVESAAKAIQYLNGTRCIDSTVLTVRFAESDVQRSVRKANTGPQQKQPRSRFNHQHSPPSPPSPPYYPFSQDHRAISTYAAHYADMLNISAWENAGRCLYHPEHTSLPNQFMSPQCFCPPYAYLNRQHYGGMSQCQCPAHFNNYMYYYYS